MPYLAYNGPVPAQSTGAIVLTAAELTEGDWVVVISDSPQLTITTLADLGQFLGAGTASTSLTAVGTTQSSAQSIPSAVSVYTTVAAGTAAKIPAGAQIGSIWDVWNAGANNLLIFPPPGAQIQTFGANNPAIVAVGGRATFVLNSATQIFAR